MARMILFDQDHESDRLEYVTQNSVVQVFAQIAEFNWKEPYKVRQEYERRGSGFFINNKGYIITNAHIIDQAKTMWVQIPALGLEPLFAEIVGFCPSRDLALLRINDQARSQIEKKLGSIPHLALGDSDVLERNDKVIVLGYPLGQYRLKSATGVLSGRESSRGRVFLQITAPINRGNSGGPLLDAQGNVVGVAIAAIIEAQNIGYAIPINELKLILEDLSASSFVRRGYLGGRFNFASDEYAQFLKNPVPAGFYVNKVFKGGLLEKAGICEGDMIYELNGYRIDAYGDVDVPWSNDKISILDVISRFKIGEQVGLVAYRKGQRLDVTFMFELTDPYPIRWIYPDYEAVEHELFGGMVIMELEENHLPYLIQIDPFLIKYEKTENRVDPALVITHIMPGSYAHQTRNLQPGFTIVEVNGIPVKTLQQLRNALSESVKTGFITLKTGDDIFVVFSLDKLAELEPQLAKDFVYDISTTLQNIIDQYKKKPPHKS